MNFKDYLEADTLNEGGHYSGKYNRQVKKLNTISQKALDAIDMHEMALMNWQENDDVEGTYPTDFMKKYAKHLKGARTYFQMCEEYTRK